MSIDKKERLVELDCLRGIAAIAVVLFHYTYAIDHNDKLLGLQYGYLGVDLFFIISGFVIFMSLERSKTKLDFPISRFLRLYPVYWLGVIITSCFLVFTGDFVSIKQFLGNLTMLQYWLAIKDIDGAYWTLAVELSFYVLIYFVYLIGKMQRILYIGLALLILEGVFYFFGFKNPLFSIFSCLKHWHLFFGGIIFYKIFTDKKVIPLTLMLLLGCLCIGLMAKNNNVERLLEFIFLAVFLKYSLTMRVFPKLIIKPLAWLGFISYPLYVIHELIGIGIIQSLDDVLGYYPVRLITLGLMILISFIIARFIEPLIRARLKTLLSTGLIFRIKT